MGVATPERRLGKTIESLSPRERAAYYRGMAAHALQLAVTAADSETKAGFVDTASCWLALAVDIETIYLADDERVRRKALSKARRGGYRPRPH